MAGGLKALMLLLNGAVSLLEGLQMRQRTEDFHRQPLGP